VVTVLFSFPYLANGLRFFPRSGLHDLVLAAVLAILWGTYFFWEKITRTYPAVRSVVRLAFGLSFLAGMAALYGAIYYLIFTR
jgi:hypothetical protein